MHTALFFHPVCLEHDTGLGHPECADRARAIYQVLEGEDFLFLDRREAPEATIDQIARVHPRGYVERILRAVPSSGYLDLDADTVLSPGSGEAAPLPVPAARIVFQDRAQMNTRFPGLVTARREAALGFETGGRILSLAADIGDRVRAGEVLAALDTRTREAQLAAARAEAAAAQADAALAETTFRRQEALREQGHISQQRLDEAAAQARAARAGTSAAEAAARAIETELELARLQAPFDGVVTARHFDEGGGAGVSCRASCP